MEIECGITSYRTTHSTASISMHAPCMLALKNKAVQHGKHCLTKGDLLNETPKLTCHMRFKNLTGDQYHTDHYQTH